MVDVTLAKMSLILTEGGLVYEFERAQPEDAKRVLTEMCGNSEELIVSIMDTYTYSLEQLVEASKILDRRAT